MEKRSQRSLKPRTCPQGLRNCYTYAVCVRWDMQTMYLTWRLQCWSSALMLVSVIQRHQLLSLQPPSVAAHCLPSMTLSRSVDTQTHITHISMSSSAHRLVNIASHHWQQITNYVINLIQTASVTSDIVNEQYHKTADEQWRSSINNVLLSAHKCVVSRMWQSCRAYRIV